MNKTNAAVIIIGILLISVGYAWAEGNSPTIRDVGFIVYGKFMDFNKMQAVNMSNISFANLNATNATANASYVDVLGNNSGDDLIFRVRNTSAQIGNLTEVMRIMANSSGAQMNFTKMQIPSNTGTPEWCIAAESGGVFLNMTTKTIDVCVAGNVYFSGNGTQKG